MRQTAIAVCAVVLMAAGVVGAAFAGEITGNGRPLWTGTVTVDGEVGHTLNGKSACAFSGQEDDQFLGGPNAANHSQSWGQNVKGIATNGGVGQIGGHAGVPGTACNPTKGETQEP